jgi:hypothetical protein
MMNLAATDPGNPARLLDLSEPSPWRNIAAHHGPVPATGLPSDADLRTWTNPCDGLADSHDRIMYMGARDGDAASLNRLPRPLRLEV